MPTINKYRTWCVKCQDWQLHTSRGGSDKCDVCGSEFVEVKLIDIPEEKLLEQRERYKAKEREKMEGFYSKLMMGTGLLGSMTDMGFFDEDGGRARNIHIQESDAGQKAIDKQKLELRKQAQQQAKEKQMKDIEDAKLFKNLGRNDKCACGSELKYKHCCMDKYKHVKHLI